VQKLNPQKKNKLCMFQMIKLVGRLMLCDFVMSWKITLI